MSSHESPFSVSIVHYNGSLLLTLAGELDIATAPLLRRTVSELIKSGLRDVKLDLRGLSFVDVVGLRAVVEARLAAVAAGVGFSLCSVGDSTLRVIRFTKHAVLEQAIEPTGIRSPAA
jgi:anti-sigma B factor antagonist